MSGVLQLQNLKSARLYLTKFWRGKKKKTPQNKDVALHLKRTLDPSLVYSQGSVPEIVKIFFLNTKLFRNRVGIKQLNLAF